jgi:uncharacterized OB-fold protein
VSASPTLSPVETCPHCGHVVKPFYVKCPQCQGEQNRSRVERLRDVVRELKASADTPLDYDRERHLLHQLAELDHPDIKGLLAWIEKRREDNSTHGARKGRR